MNNAKEEKEEKKQFEKQFAPLTDQYELAEKEFEGIDPNYYCWSNQDSLWKDHASFQLEGSLGLQPNGLERHAVWEHGTNALGYAQYNKDGSERTSDYPHNRYYSRGTDSTNVSYEKSCDKRRLEYDQRNANRVTSFNNPYAEDFPSFANYSAFSIFGDQQITMHDFIKALRYYNENEVDESQIDSEEKYGPFNQANYNIAGESTYSNKYWNKAWKNYSSRNNYSISSHPTHDPSLPQLMRIAYEIAKRFVDRFNKSFYHLQVDTNLFHLGKTRLLSIRRSTQTGWLRYDIVTSLIHNTVITAREFEVRAYLDPHTSKLVMSRAQYLGITTSDKLLLPPGYDKNQSPLNTNSDPSIRNVGRPLHPLHAKESELMPEQEANQRYWEHMVKTRSFQPSYHFDNSLPFWFRTRQTHSPSYTHKTKLGSTASMYPDRKPVQVHCTNCF